MKHHKSYHSTKKQVDESRLSAYSRATIEAAERTLKESERQSDEAFLIRAEMDRKLSAL